MSENQKSLPVAYWNVSLNVNCPWCLENVDLLEYADFWDGRHFIPGESGTEETEEVDVVCPECGLDFDVRLEY